MQIFKNQDEEFRGWVREHPDGLVVNVPSLMLHNTDCDHISDLMTKSAKACAQGANARSELQRWAQQAKGKRLLNCESCEA
ncbi:MAG TPA: hypothetical protein DEV93_02025 [Chloroflexi bacterium]|nr:hypothetical protein [Chloroflexota bacterium]